MNPFLIVPHYVSWHYTTGLAGYISLMRTFGWFFWNFFSINVLFKTLFEPFQRLKETSKGKGLDLEAMFSALATTIIMRIVGFLFRSFIIVIGLLAILVMEIIALIGLLAWVLLPFLLIAVVILGFKALFTFSNTNLKI